MPGHYADNGIFCNPCLVRFGMGLQLLEALQKDVWFRFSPEVKPVADNSIHNLIKQLVNPDLSDDGYGIAAGRCQPNANCSLAKIAHKLDGIVIHIDSDFMYFPDEEIVFAIAKTAYRVGIGRI